MEAAGDQPRFVGKRSSVVQQQQAKNRPRLIRQRSVPWLSPPHVLTRKRSALNASRDGDIAHSESNCFAYGEGGTLATRVHTMRGTLVHSASRFFGRKPGLGNGDEPENPWGVTPRSNGDADAGDTGTEEDGDKVETEPSDMIQVISTASITGQNDGLYSSKPRTKFRSFVYSRFGGNRQESGIVNEPGSGLTAEPPDSNVGANVGDETDAVLSASSETSSSSEILVVVTEDIPTEQYEDDFVNFSTATKKPKEKFRDAVRRLMLGQPPKFREI